jgi:hypothetical protein
MRAEPRYPGSAPSGRKTLEEMARGHPEYEKWKAVLGEVDREHLEDALAPEHRAIASEDVLYKEAKLYWLRRGLGVDVQGFQQTGEHRKKPQELAKIHGVSVTEAEEIMEEARRDAESFLSSKRSGIDGWHDAKKEAELEMRMLQEEIREAKRAA